VELLKETDPYSDGALVDDCRSGNPAAFDELVRRYKDRVYHVVYRFLGNHEDAQDVSQEVFLRAYQGLNQFEGRSKLYTWLYTIAGNLARNRLRDSGRRGRNRIVRLDDAREGRPMSEEIAAPAAASPEESARAQELEQAMQEVLLTLPEHFRLVFVLRTFDRLNYDEIAEIAGCPKGTVKSRLNHARKQLHARLKERQLI
jgi:RNA polymerase sigma-70 factor (ECF subfamily)